MRASTQNRHVRTFILLACFLTFVTCFAPQSQSAEDPNTKQEASAQNHYQAALERVLEKVDHLVKTQDFPGEVTASLKLTVEGGRKYLAQREIRVARNMVREAISLHKNNALAHLLHGDLTILEGRQDLSAQGYFEFWNRAQAQSEFLAQVVSEEDREILANHISARLFLYGMEPPNVEKGRDFPLKLSMNLESESLAHIIVTIAFPFLLFLGIPFFAFRRYLSVDPTPEGDRLLAQIYVTILASYLLWLAYKFTDFEPFFLNPDAEALVFGILLLCIIFAAQFLARLWGHERERRDPKSRFCSHCGKSILKIALVCPYCNQEVE